jgi:nanoRNase/pAp phosphatase (c-di-AMP/oligoRNAs hydrolase)
MLQNGGGGHQAAGTCQVEYAQAEKILKKIVETMRIDG